MAEKKEKKVIQTSSQLPSLQELSQDTWELFKKTWTAYLKLVGLAIACVFLAMLIGVLLSLPILFSAFSSPFTLWYHLTAFQIADLVLLMVWVLLFWLSCIAVSVFISIAAIRILQGKQASPVMDLIKEGKPLFWSYFFTVLIAGLLILGGLSLLVIPGLFIAFFFMFVSFEIVIDGKSGHLALKRSYFMVKNNFWEILGRVAVIVVAVIIVQSILRSLGHHNGLIGLIQFLFSLFVGWYIRAYLYLLYTSVRKHTTFPDKISIKWMWIVAPIGWVVFILLLIGAGYVLSHLPHVMPSHMHKVPDNAA